jgi:hypothetical protein
LPAEACGHGFGDLVQPRFDPGGQVGQLEVRQDVCFSHTQQVVGQGRQQPGPVLSRSTVDQHRTALGEGLEIAPKQLQVARLEGRLAVVIPEEGPSALRRQVRLAQEGDMRRFSLIAGVAVDHAPGKASGPTRRLVRPLGGSSQVHHRRQIQACDLREV